MLKFNRKAGERFYFETPAGEVIEVLIAEIRGNRVNIHVEAVENIGIYREEVWKRILAERNPPCENQ